MEKQTSNKSGLQDTVKQTELEKRWKIRNSSLYGEIRPQPRIMTCSGK